MLQCLLESGQRRKTSSAEMGAMISNLLRIFRFTVNLTAGPAKSANDSLNNQSGRS
jgi:hypothetical protein